MKKTSRNIVFLASICLCMVSCTMYEDTEAEIVQPPQITDSVSMEPWIPGTVGTDVGH